jgi:hypothetical protein
MSVERGRLLEGLLACHQEHGLGGAIWGDPAGAAAAAAATVLGLQPLTPAAPGRTVAMHSTPLDLRYSITCPTPERLHFPREGSAVTTEPPLVEVALVENATVTNWMGYHLVRCGEGLVADASSSYAPLVGAPFTNPLPEGEEVGEVEELFVSTDDIDYTNFCHFICDQLGRIALAGDCRRNIPVLVEVPQQSFQHELYARLEERHGHSLLSLSPGQWLRARRLFYVRNGDGLMHPLLRCSAWAIDFLRDLIGLPADLDAPEGSVLYLGRGTRRRLLNEAELIEALQRRSHHLTVVEELGTLGVREQAELVCRHQQVVGPHGAGFTHLLFRQRGPVQATELLAEGNGSLAFALMSARLGIRHGMVVGDSSASTKGPNYPDLTVPVAEVLALMDGGSD